MRILQLFCSFSSTVDQTFRSTEDRFGLLNYMGLMVPVESMVVRLCCSGKSWLGATGPLISVRKFCPPNPVMRNSFVQLWSSTTTLSPCWLLVAATLIVCGRAKAQAHPDGSPTVQTQTVPEPEQLLWKAQENAKVVAQDEIPPPVGVRHESKALQNPAQRKLPPNTSSLPDNSRPNSPKQTALTDAKESVAEAEAIKQDHAHNPQSEDSGKVVNTSNGSIWEPTGITVSRLFLAGDGANEEVKVPMSVPVLYESRLLALDKDKQRAIARLLDKLTSYRTRLAAMKKRALTS